MTYLSNFTDLILIVIFTKLFINLRHRETLKKKLIPCITNVSYLLTNLRFSLRIITNGKHCTTFLLLSFTTPNIGCLYKKCLYTSCEKQK